MKKMQLKKLSRPSSAGARPEPQPVQSAPGQSVFELLHEELRKQIEKAGYKAPTEVQRQTIPTILAGKDACGVAKTGQGKTAAYALPTIHRIIESQQPFFCLVLAPTRELCLQIGSVFQQFGDPLGLRVVTLIGNVELEQQQRALRKNPHVIVATPARLQDLLSNTVGFKLTQLKTLILDEADKLLDLGFEPQMDGIFKQITPPRRRQTLLFTATFDGRVERLKNKICSGAVFRSQEADAGAGDGSVVGADSAVQRKTNTQLKELLVVAPDDSDETRRPAVLVQLLSREFQAQKTLVFFNRKQELQKLYYVLKKFGLPVGALHGDLDQKKRLESLQALKQNGSFVLLATDVAGRGLDISGVDLVINYRLPELQEEYVHRVGRTARAGAFGTALSLVSREEIAALQRIEKFTGKTLEKTRYDKEAAERRTQEIAGALHIAGEIIKGRMKESEL